jgi:hypothetical protein
MEHAEGRLIELVTRFGDIMIEEGTDQYGPVHSPMFASVLRTASRRIPSERPPDIPGQRTGDRSYGGGNLLHDIPLLGTFYALGRLPGGARFTEASDRYLRWFLENGPNPVTGLFPWGEHTYWHFVYEREWAEAEFGIGDHIHDHLRQAPVWFWEKAWELAPQRVIDFANGLQWHIVDEESFEYIRHAYINRQARHRPGARSCDFPRHGGFYLLDWVFAYVKSGQRHFLDWAERMDRYHQDHMDPRFQALLIETRTNNPAFERFTGSQQLSLALSLLEATTLLESAPEVADRFRQHAHLYIDGYLRMPHRPAEGLFAGATDRKDNRLAETPRPWGSLYGDWPLAYVGLICTGLHRQTARNDILEIAAAMADTVRRAPFPEQGCIPALDLGLAIGLAVDLFDLTGEPRYRDQALQHAETALQRYWVNGLFRGATHHGAYDSQMGVAYLVHALARLGTMERPGSCPIPPDYTAR